MKCLSGRRSTRESLDNRIALFPAVVGSFATGFSHSSTLLSNGSGQAGSRYGHAAVQGQSVYLLKESVHRFFSNRPCGPTFIPVKVRSSFAIRQDNIFQAYSNISPLKLESAARLCSSSGSFFISKNKGCCFFSSSTEEYTTQAGTSWDGTSCYRARELNRADGASSN